MEMVTGNTWKLIIACPTESFRREYSLLDIFDLEFI
jgi:hypothetical protein